MGRLAPSGDSSRGSPEPVEARLISEDINLSKQFIEFDVLQGTVIDFDYLIGTVH